MSIPRRNFLKSATMTTLSAGLALGSAHLIFGQQARKAPAQSVGQAAELDAFGNFAIPMEAQQAAFSYFRASTFSPYVGDIFQAANSRGEMVELKLTRVSEYKMSKAGRALARQARQPESFALTFSASGELPPFTSIHKVSHPRLGEFDVFLTSHKSNKGALLYEAVFNHMR